MLPPTLARHALPALPPPRPRARALPRVSAAPPPSASGPTTDATVPDGHAGLHAQLYGDGDGGVAHASRERVYAPRPDDDGSSVAPVPAWLAERAGEPPVPGVVALYDAKRAIQYVGVTRDAVAAVRGAAARLGADRVAAVRALLVANQAMVSRAALQEQADAWLQGFGTTPPGNGPDAPLFAGLTATGRTALAQEEHDDRAAKLRRAMALEAAAGEGEDAARDPAALRAAMESDDWSIVIDGQTKATLPATPAAAAPAGPATPFAQAGVHRSVGAGGPSPAAALTVESAEAALDEVRPYLLADGGDVQVVSVDDGVVKVRLQGACGTCASAGATMAMGIERALKAAFGDAVASVARVDDGPGGLLGADDAPTAAAVDAMLDGLRPAIAAYGGSVSVGDIGGDRVCRLAYEGPPPLATGILAAVKDRFPGLADVVLE